MLHANARTTDGGSDMEAIEELARDRGVSVTDLIREAVRRLLSRSRR